MAQMLYRIALDFTGVPNKVATKYPYTIYCTYVCETLVKMAIEVCSVKLINIHYWKQTVQETQMFTQLNMYFEHL